MTERALQDLPDELWAQCWGCGRENQHGLQIKSYWDGAEAVCTWTPEPHHCAAPGILNGGIIASLIDCHSVWTAIAAAYQAEGRGVDSEPAIQYVTANLNITYLRPTSMSGPVTLRARVREVQGRRTTVECSLFSADGQECATGVTIAARVREGWQAS